MPALGSTPAPEPAARIAMRLALARITSGVAEAPSGAAVTLPVVRSSSFGGFPTAPLVTPALNPAAVAAAYAFGD